MFASHLVVIMRVTKFAGLLQLGIALLGSLALCGCSPSSQTSAPASASPASVPSLSDEQLQRKLDEVIAFTRARHMSAEEHNAWQIVHGILAYGRDLKIKAAGELVSALDYLLAGGKIRGWTMRPGDHGLESVMEPGTKQGQGHPDQWIGYLAQCGLSPDDAIIVDGRTFYLRDLLTQAQWSLYPGMEASWTLMALSTYLPPRAVWTSKDGSQWTVEKIAAMEARQDLAESPCGGTHRLYGLALALNQHLAQGGKITGGWQEADRRVSEAIATAQRFQQPDGNFSTNFFQRPGSSAEVATVLHATGHTFEFLTMAMTDDQVRQPWMRKAAIQLCNLLEETRGMEVECGALYHAAHGLILYRDRLFAPRVAGGDVSAAAQPK
jgi:hypothetical protein